MFGNLFIEDGGKISLSKDVREHYDLTPDTPLRIVETRGGILLVPLTHEPMSESLARELDEWQSLGAASFEMFP
ncbi:MAG: AbrB/MazE/SpoVT family DNA-binding domain-containing protein [Acidobacteriota bacterium]|nr:AbrB/MazE/SpoVT family DNA-binding domain-containing protein [Acidobacteriota bacterium]